MAVLMVITLTGCTSVSQKEKASGNINIEDNGKLNVVATLFPYYDFVRQIAGDKVNLTMIVPAGMDTHSFEPTTDDMACIQKADVFIYNGGSIENWVTKVLASFDKKKQVRECMMDYVDVVTEETVEGMEAEDEHDDKEEKEYDEHIWTSPVNAQKIVTQICEALKKADSDNAEYYQQNADGYIQKLQKLDSEFKDVVKHAKRKTIVFGDKFPLRYFVDEYGLDYYAAFAGCSTDTEPSVNTMTFLIDKVKKEKIPVVYYLELSSHKIADTICSSTNAKKMVFYTCHNVTKKQFDDGVTYVDMMEHNVQSLKEGLK